MSVEKRVQAYLELAAKDVEAADLLLAGGNRYAAYHVQQSIEKVTKALLLARGIEAGVEHRLEELCKNGLRRATSGRSDCVHSSGTPRTPLRSGTRHPVVASLPTRPRRSFAATCQRSGRSSPPSAMSCSARRNWLDRAARERAPAPTGR